MCHVHDTNATGKNSHIFNDNWQVPFSSLFIWRLYAPHENLTNELNDDMILLLQALYIKSTKHLCSFCPHTNTLSILNPDKFGDRSWLVSVETCFSRINQSPVYINVIYVISCHLIEHTAAIIEWNCVQVDNYILWT